MVEHLGKQAPDFMLMDTEGHEWRLSEHLGSAHVVLVFNRGLA